MCCSMPAASHIGSHSALSDFPVSSENRPAEGDAGRRPVCQEPGPHKVVLMRPQNHIIPAAQHTLYHPWSRTGAPVCSASLPFPVSRVDQGKSLHFCITGLLRAGDSPAGRPWERVLQQHCYRQRVLPSSLQHLQRNILKEQRTCLLASLGKVSCSSTATGSICCSPFHSRRSSSPTGCHQQFATSSWPTTTPAFRQGMAGIRCPRCAL